MRDANGISLFLADPDQRADSGYPIGAAFVNTEWNILSSFDQTTDSAVYLHHLSLDGSSSTPPQGVFAVVGLGPHRIHTGPVRARVCGDCVGVTTNGNPVGEWLFLRNEKVNSTTYHILGKRVGFDGTDYDPVPFQLDTATEGKLRNAVAAQCGTQFLAAWLDGRNANRQPGDAANIFGAMVDTTVADPGTPLVPVISASPTSGNKPLDVTFDAGQSTGTYDSVQWDFGDGAGVSSTSPGVTHWYAKDGTYTAQLTLTRGSYSVYSTVIIVVGKNGDIVPVGTPLPDSQEMVSNLFIESSVITFDFTQTGNDSAQVSGIMDISTLPTSMKGQPLLTGLTGKVFIGSVSYPFTLDAKGQYTSDTSVNPRYRIALNGRDGIFNFFASKDELQATISDQNQHMVVNETTPPYAVYLQVPFTVQLGAFNATTTMGMKYTATWHKNGTLKYSFLKTGETDSGVFLITSFTAQVQRLPPTHSFTIKGQLVRPNLAKYAPAPTGNFVFEIGNYTLQVPAAQFAKKGGVMKYTGRAMTAGGLKAFTINNSNGKFVLQFVKVPATGASGSGMPLSSGSDIINVLLNLSFEFDLSDQANFTAGRYIFVTRKNATAMKWILQK